MDSGESYEVELGEIEDVSLFSIGGCSERICFPKKQNNILNMILKMRKSWIDFFLNLFAAKFWITVYFEKRFQLQT